VKIRRFVLGQRAARRQRGISDCPRRHVAPKYLRPVQINHSAIIPQKPRQHIRVNRRIRNLETPPKIKRRLPIAHHDRRFVSIPKPKLRHPIAPTAVIETDLSPPRRLIHSVIPIPPHRPGRHYRIRRRCFSRSSLGGGAGGERRVSIHAERSPPIPDAPCDQQPALHPSSSGPIPNPLSGWLCL